MIAGLTHTEKINPRYKLRSNGQPIQDVKVHTLIVEQQVNRIPLARLFIIDGDAAKREFKASNMAQFRPGAQLEIELGYEKQSFSVFTGSIVRHSIRASRDGSTMLCLELKHRAVRMSHQRRSRVFVDQSEADILRSIATENDLDLSIEASLDQPQERLVQYHAFDWDFLVTRAEARNCFVRCTEQGIQIAQATVDTAAEVPTFTFGKDIWNIEAEIEARSQYGEVQSNFWDYSAQEKGQANAQHSGLGNESADPQEIFGDAALQLLHPGLQDSNEAQDWAESSLQRSELARVRGKMSVKGAPEIFPGSSIQLAGTSDHFNGRAFVSAIRHEFTPESFLSDIEFGMAPERYADTFPLNDLPVSGLLPRMAGLHIGLVRQVEDDPQGQHRVLVAFAALDAEVEGIWARVASPDAGENHGLFFRPEIGDEVVLGFLNEDPREAIVLGALFNNSPHAPPFGDDPEYQKRGLLTASGLRVELDETDDTITLETPAGDRLQISGGRGGEEGILMKDQHGNELEMGQQAVFIRSKGKLILESDGEMVMKSKQNVKIKAGIKLKMEGVSTELSGSATTDIKGGLIKLN